MPVLLSEQDVRIVLSMPDLIEAMERALVGFSSREVAQPLRSVIEVGLQTRIRRRHAGVYSGTGCAGHKSGQRVREQHGRRAADAPRDDRPARSDDGRAASIMDGRFITEARTAAVSAVSVRHLAHRDASRLAIIGSGVQARSHLEAVALVRDLREVRVWSRSLDNRTAFAREMRSRVDAPVDGRARPRRMPSTART